MVGGGVTGWKIGKQNIPNRFITKLYLCPDCVHFLFCFCFPSDFFFFELNFPCNFFLPVCHFYFGTSFFGIYLSLSQLSWFPGLCPVLKFFILGALRLLFTKTILFKISKKSCGLKCISSPIFLKSLAQRLYCTYLICGWHRESKSVSEICHLSMTSLCHQRWYNFLSATWMHT